jgi:hypothetical protein
MDATVIIVKPTGGKSTRSHKRAVCVGDGGDVEVESQPPADDGTATTTPTSTPESTPTATSTSESSAGDGGEELTSGACEGSGDGLILLTRKKTRDGDEVEVRTAERVAKIEERLDKQREKLKASGKTDQLAKLDKKVEEQVKRTEDRTKDAEERLQKKVARDEARAGDKFTGPPAKDDKTTGPPAKDDEKGGGKGKSG